MPSCRNRRKLDRRHSREEEIRNGTATSGNSLRGLFDTYREDSGWRQCPVRREHGPKVRSPEVEASETFRPPGSDPSSFLSIGRRAAPSSRSNKTPASGTALYAVQSRLGR